MDDGVYTVIHRDKAEALRRLAEMCDALGLRPMGGGRAIQSPSTGKWLVRAEPVQDVSTPSGR
jgi:hypothetical protein